ncbi:hypothetical protein PV797_18845 [Clostridiaceae bacterium M8S5]|nr:hypothetical protein PV797_18845 [Clostridiaceae bacterium M8S5]
MKKLVKKNTKATLIVNEVSYGCMCGRDIFERADNGAGPRF